MFSKSVSLLSIERTGRERNVQQEKSSGGRATLKPTICHAVSIPKPYSITNDLSVPLCAMQGNSSGRRLCLERRNHRGNEAEDGGRHDDLDFEASSHSSVAQNLLRLSLVLIFIPFPRHPKP